MSNATMIADGGDGFESARLFLEARYREVYGRELKPPTANDGALVYAMLRKYEETMSAS